MKTFTVFGYQLTIRKTRTRHPLDTKGYKRENDTRRDQVTAQLKRYVNNL